MDKDTGRMERQRERGDWHQWNGRQEVVGD